ncbi:MAG: twin-arginine translocase subunit TatC [Litorivicinaceae bacterium]|nr:twin-arginine translocase subunit TatC [Gammaproteobacteria bacterium]RPG21025.1 MAG: twin-arginine translocase subunit TatC [Oceanospirillales bacterium TMED33]RZO75093.1 MAG: twin-arginine translocase subunit TatC [Litorivicinaceae bacterium]CAI8373312.1 MAG: Sec-independent protein translocase protein TatC [Gammaproteobacteria bacterium]|tara:strand:- start:108 stop:1076 length:969 start_codon:yes stop_codon:yes gene_type:complete
MSEPSLNDQPLIAHLIELRDRLIRILVVILIFFLGFIAFANDLYAYLANPLQSLLPEGASMIATQVASPFLAPFKLALYLSVYCGAPMILYQLWGFIAPGLYDNEKKIAGPLLISSIVLFYAGMAFAYFAVFPLVFGFFTTVGPTGVTVMTDIDAYLSFVLKLFLAFGLAFEIPIATMLLIKAGIASPDSLKDKRPYVFIGCFVVGMLVTPPDVISQTLLAVPMWLLFEVGLIGARFLGTPKPKTGDLEEDEATVSTAPRDVATIENEATDDNLKEGEVDEFDLYAPAHTDDGKPPINEELDKPEGLDNQDPYIGPTKPGSA